MNWATYESQCHRPDHLSRWTLQQMTEFELMAHAGCAELRDVLLVLFEHVSLRKPRSHQDPRTADIFVLNFEPHFRIEIRSFVRNARSAGDVTAQTRDRGLGGLSKHGMSMAISRRRLKGGT